VSAGGLKRDIRSTQEMMRDIAAIDIDDPGIAGKHIRSIRSSGDFSGWPRNRQTAGDLGTYGDNASGANPALQDLIIRALVRAIVADRFAE
jgi:hypothetical protein